MKRICVDCRECPGNTHCSLVLCSDNEKDLLEASVKHLVTFHDAEDTPELRESLSMSFQPKTIESEGESFNEALSYLSTIRIPY